MGFEHKWNGTVLTITSDSGTTAMDLKGDKGDTGARGVRGLPGKMGGGALIEDNVISEETVWSSKGIMDRFADAMSESGNPVVCNPIPNFPLHIHTTIEPKTSGVSSVSVTRCGKNLLNYDEWKKVIIQNGKADFENNGVTLTANDNDCFTDYDSSMEKARVYVDKGDVYTLSWEETTNTEGMVYIFPNGKTAGMVSIDNNGNKKLSYTVGENVEFITFRFGVTKSGNTIKYKNIQLEKGSIATAYESYKGNTYTMEFANNVYGGFVDWNKGIVTAEYGENGEPLEEPYTIELTPQVINAIDGVNVLYTDADSISVYGRVDTMYELTQLKSRLAALEAAIINA